MSGATGYGPGQAQPATQNYVDYLNTRKPVGQTWNPGVRSNTDTGANSGGMQNTYMPYNATQSYAAPAAAPAAAVPQQDKTVSKTGGGDVAYTGGDANALQMNTMDRMRGAASQRLFGRR